MEDIGAVEELLLLGMYLRDRYGIPSFVKVLDGGFSGRYYRIPKADCYKSGDLFEDILLEDFTVKRVDGVRVIRVGYSPSYGMLVLQVLPYKRRLE